MHKYDRVMDGDGRVYAKEPRAPLYDYNLVRVYPLYADGHVGAPLQQPLEELRHQGCVYLRHNKVSWIATEQVDKQRTTALRVTAPQRRRVAHG